MLFAVTPGLHNLPIKKALPVSLRPCTSRTSLSFRLSQTSVCLIALTCSTLSPSQNPLMFHRVCFSLSRVTTITVTTLYLNPSTPFTAPQQQQQQHQVYQQQYNHKHFTCKMSNTHHHNNKPKSPILLPEKATKPELLLALKSSLGSAFNTNPIFPPPSPQIIVISGPSGVGKDTVITKLLQRNANLHFVVTATTRPMRPGEVDGKDYYFVSKEEFLSMIEKNELLEHGLVYGDYKGIPKQQIKEFMAKGCDIVLRVSVQGAETLRKILGSSAVFIFLTAESELKLAERLIGRKTESDESLLIRVAAAREELKHVRSYDYVVLNAEGELDRAVRLVESIIDAEKAKVWRRNAVI